MPPSRPSRYCLSLQDDSVFADFDLDDNGRIFLLRISFDGYGCCPTAESARAMSTEDSNEFVSLIESDGVNTSEMRSILSRYFSENSDVIWKDALMEHELIDSRSQIDQHGSSCGRFPN